MEALKKSQDGLSRAVEDANAQLTAKTAPQVAAIQQAYRATLKQMTQVVEGRLAWFLAEYEERLEAVAERVLQELADRVAGLHR